MLQTSYLNDQREAGKVFFFNSLGSILVGSNYEDGLGRE
jgi:hypothetical protein